MPEAPVYKNAHLVRAKDDVRLATKVWFWTALFSESQPRAVKCSPQDNLGASVSLQYGLHYPTTPGDDAAGALARIALPLIVQAPPRRRLPALRLVRRLPLAVVFVG